MEKIRPNIRLIVSCFLVFILALCLRLHFINIKQGLHMDEVLSISISNISNYLWNETLPHKTILTGKQIKQMGLFNNTSLDDTISDIKSMHKDNQDPPHTNLYYSIFRAWFNGFDSTELKDIVWRGCSLNLIFFSISFFIMYKILKRLFEDDVLIPFGLLVAFLNTGTISNTLFLRPYQLQETILLLLIYVSINFYFAIKNKTLITTKNFIIGATTIALALLSGYLPIILIGLLGLGLLTIAIKEKQNKSCMFLFGTLITSILLAWLGYFGYFLGFTSDHAQGTITLLNNFVDNFTFFLLSYTSNMLYFIYYIPCLILLCFLGIRRFKKNMEPKNSKIIKYLIIVSLVWTILVMFLVNFKVVRYLEPVFPILAMIYPYVLTNLEKVEKKIYIAIFSTLFVFFAAFPQPAESIDSSYLPIKTSIPTSSKIENLFLSSIPFTSELSKNPNTLVIVKDTINFNHWVPLLNDNQPFLITDGEIPKTNLEEMYFLALNKYKLPAKMQQNVKKQIYGGWDLILYKIKNK